MRVRLTISEPWDLGEALGWRPLEGILMRIEDDSSGGIAVIHLDAPIETAKHSVQYLLVSIRHQGDRLSDVLVGKQIACAAIGISREESESAILDTKRWRAGLGLVGSLQRV